MFVRKTTLLLLPLLAASLAVNGPTAIAVDDAAFRKETPAVPLQNKSIEEEPLEALARRYHTELAAIRNNEYRISIEIDILTRHGDVAGALAKAREWVDQRQKKRALDARTRLEFQRVGRTAPHTSNGPDVLSARSAFSDEERATFDAIIIRYAQELDELTDRLFLKKIELRAFQNKSSADPDRLKKIASEFAALQAERRALNARRQNDLRRAGF